MKFLDELKKVLISDDRFVGEADQIIKTKVSDAARANDEKLLKALLDNNLLKEVFFTKVDDIYVFDKNKFAWVLESKEFLPDSYTMYKNKIGLVDSNNNLISQKQDVSLVWPYKDCVLEGGQTKEEQKRDEIFYNETLAPDQVNRLLAPKVLGNAKRYTKDGIEENIEFKEDDNLIIKGNNLLALSSLLEKFENKVKLIYIDPPYNTGNDSFGYNDTFNHSTWLTFIKNRLEFAKRLLSENGIIAVHCDDNEQAYIKVLMDDIFNKEKFINTVSIKSSTPSGLKTAHKDKTIVKQKDYIHIYKIKDDIKIKPQYTAKSNYDTHYNGYLDKDNNKVYRLVDILKENGLLNRNEGLGSINLQNEEHMKFLYKHKDFIYQTAPEIPKDIKELSLKEKDKIITYGSKDNLQYAYNGRRLTFLSGTFKEVFIGSSQVERPANLLCDFWDDIDFQNTQNQGGVSFRSGKKPEQLIYRIIDMFTHDKELVLDFFLGSGTTASVAHKMGRKYIGIEQMDNQIDLSLERLEKVLEGEQSGISKNVNWQGGGSFVYCELMEDNENLVNELENAKNSDSVKKILNKAIDNGKLIPSVLPRDLKENEDDFDKLSLDEQKNLVMELLNKNQLYVNLSDIDDEDYKVSEADKAFTRSFYGKE